MSERKRCLFVTSHRLIGFDPARLHGDVNGLRGDVSKLIGDVSGLFGDVSGLFGDVSGLFGDVSGLSGDVSGLSGDVDDAGLTDEERAAGVNIRDLIRDDAQEVKP